MAAAARLWCSICTPAEWAGPPIIKHIIAASPSFSSLTKSELKYTNTNTNTNNASSYNFRDQHRQAEKALNIEICLATDITLPQERSISDLGYKHAAIATALRFSGPRTKKNCEKQSYFFFTMTFPPTARKQSCSKCYDQNGLHPMQWQAKRLISQYHTHPNRLGKNYSVPKWNSVF